MKLKTKRTLVPYEILPPGVEAVYTGEDPSTEIPETDVDIMPGYSQVIRIKDESGDVIEKWSTWNLPVDRKVIDGDWGDQDINFINSMQRELDPLDDETRKLRSHIGNMVMCDNGIPVTIDEILNAIGTGKLPDPCYHNGCCVAGAWWDVKGTQPGQVEAMQVIETVVKDYIDGADKDVTLSEFPLAAGFIERFYDWFPSRENLSDVQDLMLQRFLLPFEFLTKRVDDHATVHRECFEPGGRGVEIDGEIAKSAGLPKIYANYKKEYLETRDSIEDPMSKDIYRLAGAMAHGLHGLSDCHHSTFRWLELWLHGIATGKLEIESRKSGVERERLGKLLFGYVFALDKWLAGRSMHFVLLDLGHVDLGFDPKNEILRVYAYLGDDRSPLKRWLAASLWWTLANNSPAGLLKRHEVIINQSKEAGLNIREWIAGLE